MTSGRERIRRVLHLGESDGSVDEELAYHFDRTVEDLVAQGMERREAEATAARRFGNVTWYRAELRNIDRRMESRRRWGDRLETVTGALHYAVRSLTRSPGLSIGIILVFALGIGANLSMYAVVDRLLLSPPEHIEDPSGVRRIYVSEYLSYVQDRITEATLSYPDYRQLKGVSAFEELAGVAPRPVTIGSGLDATERNAVYVTANFFPLLGVQPAAGRFFNEAEDRVGGARQAVLSWDAWQRDHGGAADALGRTIDFGYGPYTIVGVTPKGFTGVDLARVDVWLPFHVVRAETSGTDWMEHRGEQFFTTVARLKEGVSFAAAESEATAAWISGREGTEWQTADSDPRVLLTPLLNELGPDAAPESAVAKLLLIVSAIVLLIAAVNVANLLLARSLRQQGEIALRLALGISRRRLLTQVLIEGVLLAAAGGVAALLLASWATRFIGTVLLPDVAWQGSLTARVALVGALLALVSGLAAALVPAVQAARGSAAATLRQAQSGGASHRAARLRTGLVVLQTSLSVLLLVGAGLFVRSLERVRGADFGFEADGLIYAVPRTLSGSVPQEEMHRIVERGRAALIRVPGVRAVGTTQTLPFYSFRTTRLRAEGVDSIVLPPTRGPFLNEVSAGYLEAMGIDVLAGRSIAESDIGASEHIALINSSMAEALWPARSPIGRCLFVGGSDASGPQTRCTRIVGVVEDSRRQEVRNLTTFQYYLPTGQHQAPRSSVFVIRVAAETPEVLTAIRRTVLGLDSRIRHVDAEPLLNRIAPWTRSWELGAAMFSVFGLLALVVAGIGLYSMLAFDVARRTREIGVRSALGASSSILMRMIVGNALGLTAAGAAVGTVAAIGLAGRVQPLLFETRARDPLTLIAVLLVLLLVAVLASSIPAWRASRVDPNVALRAE